MADYFEPPQLSAFDSKVEGKRTDTKKVQRCSMIKIRKDYSYKLSSPPSTSESCFELSSHSIASPTVQKREPIKNSSVKRSPISILERYDYNKADTSPSLPKIIKVDNKTTPPCAIPSNTSAIKSHVPVKKDHLKVFVESPVVKQEVVELKSPPCTPESTKINNKINIIFQLNDNKSLRLLHRRTPSKKIVQKITIKETNNNGDEVVPDKVFCNVDTQTVADSVNVNFTTSNPLSEEPTEHLFFDENLLISLQTSTVSFFEFSRLGALLKKGEADFELIDRIPRRLHDTLIHSDQKFQCLCYNDLSLPIYVEMRAKQKELEDPEQCPIAFLYCNVYYCDQRRVKFSSVHLDTVKAVISDIMYTCIPRSSYFIMAWNEKSFDTKGLDTGIVKYKLTPNLDLAKLASIRQFPKLNYRTKQINCGKG